MKRPYPWKCRTCRERKVSPATVDYTTDLEHDGRLYSIVAKDLEVLRCENCGAVTLPDAAYETLMLSLRTQAGLLTPSQIAELRSGLQLNQKEFARLLGVAPETVSRWETGGQIQQRVMNDFMRTFFDLPEAREYLKWLRSVPPGTEYPKATSNHISTAATEEMESESEMGKHSAVDSLS